MLTHVERGLLRDEYFLAFVSRLETLSLEFSHDDREAAVRADLRDRAQHFRHLRTFEVGGLGYDESLARALPNLTARGRWG